MRIVYWHPQERVDVPDLTAASFLMLGEFRRTNRALIVGEERNAIIRGYAVEAESPATSSIVVRLQDGAEPLSLAMLSENMGPHIAYGQLAGDKNDDEDLEGNASYSLDFAAQPAATYTVQMRFVYADGATDNRAFWDDGTDTETISSVATRHLPTVELRLSGTPSDEWIDLASVVWDGSSIETADITDLRVFLLEGGPASTGWRQASQTGTGGMPDFDRSTDRATVGLNTVVPFLKALARQLQDIKGQDDSGYFNWWSRVFSPMDPADTLGVQTKSLRTIDHVMYTVSDGVTDFGDFNGATGLHTLLTLIQTSAASLPAHITIVLKSRATWSSTLSGTYALGTKKIKIVGGFGDRLAEIDCTTAAASNVFSFTAGGGLELENVVFTSPTNEVTMFSAAAASFVARNCEFYNLDTRTRVYADLPSSGILIDGCTIGSLFGGSAGVWCISDSVLTSAREQPGKISRTEFLFGQLLLYRGTSHSTLTGRVRGLRFEDCSIYSTLTPIAGSLGTIQAVGAVGLVLDNCHVATLGDEDALLLATGDDGASFYPVSECVASNCRFALSGGSHAADLGTGLTAGTGWGVHVKGHDDGLAQNIAIDGCRFSGSAPADAGAIRAKGVAGLSVRSPVVRDVTLPAGARFTAFYIEGGIGTPFAAGAVIDQPVVERFSGSGTNIRGFDFNLCSGVHVTGGVFRGVDTSGATIVIGTSGFAGRLTDCGDCTIERCLFDEWESATNDRGILIQSSSNRLRFSGNTFTDVSGRVIYLASGTAHENNEYDRNFFSGSNIVCGIDCTALTLASPGHTYTNNRMPTSLAVPIIRLGDDRYFVCTGNSAPAGSIDHTTSGSAPFVTAIGHSETYKANVVASYT